MDAPLVNSIGSDDAHRAPVELMSALCQVPAPVLALSERLQRCETLDAVQEVRTQIAVRLATSEAADSIPSVEQGWYCKREEGEREEDECDIDVERHHVREYGDRGDRGHDDLGQVLSEEGLEALDAFHQREDHVAGPVSIEVSRTEFQRVFIDLVAQPDLDDIRRVVTDRVLPVLEEAARYDQRCNGRQRQGERREARLAG